MKKVFLFFNQQKLFSLLLVLLIIVPFTLMCLFATSIPYTPYFFLISLFFLKTIIFDQNTLEKNLAPVVNKELAKELKRPPSKNEIFKRVLFHIKARDISLLITLLYVVVLGIIFDRF